MDSVVVSYTKHKKKRSLKSSKRKQALHRSTVAEISYRLTGPGSRVFLRRQSRVSHQGAQQIDRELQLNQVRTRQEYRFLML